MKSHPNIYDFLRGNLEQIGWNSCDIEELHYPLQHDLIKLSLMLLKSRIEIIQKVNNIKKI